MTQDDLEKYNPGNDFYDSLLLDWWVCYSEGELSAVNLAPLMTRESRRAADRNNPVA